MSYTLLFNTTATHGLPAAINQASSALLRTVTGNPGASIAVQNHPLPTLQQEAAVRFSKVAGQSPSARAPSDTMSSWTGSLLCPTQKACDQPEGSFPATARGCPHALLAETPELQVDASGVCLHAGDLLLVLCLTMASSVLSASFAVFLVRECECHSKGVQMVAGASPSAFWSAAYAWDLLNFSVPALGAATSSMLLQLLNQLPSWVAAYVLTLGAAISSMLLQRGSSSLHTHLGYTHSLCTSLLLHCTTWEGKGSTRRRALPAVQRRAQTSRQIAPERI